MWYVIQTMGGKEHEVSMWINTFVDKSLFQRCFVPLYEDVWRKQGIGNISVKKMFGGYLFLETDQPAKMHEAMKEILTMTKLLYLSEKEEGRVFLPILKEEEIFFDTVLSDGLMKVSYIHMSGRGKLDQVIGPLQSYADQIVRVDLPHRRAIVEIPILGEPRRVKFGLWLDKDPKQEWIEQEKKRRAERVAKPEEQVPDNPWDWKAWKEIKKGSGAREIEEGMLGVRVGDMVVNTTGIYGDTPLEVLEVRTGKNTVVVSVSIFGSMTKVEMGIGDVEIL